MTAIAMGTETIEIGPGITNPYTRHPSTTAAAIASIDELSGGRAFLGVGVGGSLTLDPLGIDRSRPLTAVRETIEGCRRLFQGHPVDLEGNFLTLRGARLGFARPDIEIWLAGRGPKMLQLGGETCDGVMFDFIHKEVIPDVIELVGQGAARSGNRPKLCYSTMIVTNERAMEQTRPQLTYRLVDSTPRVKELLGITEDDVARIRNAMAGGPHAAAEHVRDEWVYPFIISGSIDECAAELSETVRRHQIDEFLLPVFELDTAIDLMEAVAPVLVA
jgi:5,10-methylenetetrahydromethanopterin reductase